MAAGQRASAHALLMSALCAILAPYPAHGDLPIHCLKKWVFGDWTLTRGPPSDNAVSCGYDAPDNNAQHFRDRRAFDFVATDHEQLELKLVRPNKVLCLGGCGGQKGGVAVEGTFTMVYDEGFEIRLPDFRFFAFFHYIPKPQTDPSRSDKLELYESTCSRTRTGWAHDGRVSPKMWRCASMEQTRADNPQGCHNGDSSANDIKSIDPVVSPIPKQNDDSQDDNSESTISKQEGLLTSGVAAESWSTWHHRRHQRHQHAQTNALELPIFRRHNRINGSRWCARSHGGVSARHHATVALVQSARVDGMFRYNMSWIAAHNANPESLWRATTYSQFNGMPLRDAMRYLGTHKRVMSTVVDQMPLMASERVVVDSDATTTTTTATAATSTGLPKSFNWRTDRGIETPIKNQGSCGSCYAQAALDVADMRVMIATSGPSPNFSVDEHIQKSFYNQGCDGGYPFLVGKQGRDFGFITSKCYSLPQSADRDRCVSADRALYRVSSYGYVGGYYGGTTEAAMMNEIYKNGPVVAAFEPSSSFFAYESGVYTGPKGPHTDDWEKTDHAIVLMGWGETENGVKYWVAKNSWGKEWGENGYFSIRRGTDETGIESMSVFLQMDINLNAQKALDAKHLAGNL